MIQHPAATVIVFAKAPRAGAVKTRLSQDIGAVAAAWWQRRATDAILRRLAAEPRWRLRLALTPDGLRMARLSARADPSAAREGQGPGDLGRRMAIALRRIDGPVALVGTDIPELDADAVRAAFRRLSGADYVFGPTFDGGFWLIAARRGRALALSALLKARWSTPYALDDAIASLGPRAAVAFAPRLADVDAAADLKLRGGRPDLRRPSR